ncbi:MAG TPA: Lrp/AsnC family transcriptional regulator [Acidimicrobiales bacterium]|nr:Lrp/AsnC family transcriptional regulator [Acidimicrobiales bacterium]
MEKLDDTDQELVNLLQIDGRATYAAMAAKIGLSPAAVRKRVTRLFDKGIVKGVVIVDPLKLGYHVAALLGIRCVGPLEATSRAIEMLPDIAWAVLSSGRYDLMVEVACVDTDHLMRRVDEFRELDNVTEVEVIVIMKYIKFGNSRALPSAPGEP